MKGKIYFELGKCMSCHSCELACALEHSQSKELSKAIHEDPRPVARVHVENINGVGFSLQCQHCEDAPCVSVCPREAIAKLGPGEPVIIDEEKCTGCNFCVAACPFGAVSVQEQGNKVAVKCDLCPELTKEGLEPACVSGCPAGARHFGTEEKT